MAELILIGAASFIVGAIAGMWVLLKIVRFMKRGALIQDIAVVRDAKGQPFAEFCVDINVPISIPKNWHIHPRFRINFELADELIAGMDKAEHPHIADVHDHMVRGGSN